MPSASTLYRVARGVDAARLGALRAAAAHARQRVWPQIAAARGEVVIDIDASLVEVHSENKEGTAAHYKGGFGFHPMYAFADCTGECLAVQLRPGNAAARGPRTSPGSWTASTGPSPTPVSSCGASRFARAPSGRCSPATTGATGATGPTSRAAPRPETPT